MKIADVKTTAVRVPLSEPVKWSGGTRGTAPALIVEIETDSGIVGLGECAGPHIPVIRTAVDAELRPLLIGQDPLRTEFQLHRMDEHVITGFAPAITPSPESKWRCWTSKLSTWVPAFPTCWAAATETPWSIWATSS